MLNIISLFATPQMQWVIILVGIDVVLGILAAVFRKEFTFSKLGDFMKGPVLAYILGFALVEIIGLAKPTWDIVVSIVFVLIVIALLASIFGNLGKLGLPLPGTLRKR